MRCCALIYSQLLFCLFVLVFCFLLFGVATVIQSNLWLTDLCFEPVWRNFEWLCDLFWGLVTLYLAICVLNRCEGILNDCVICPEDWWPYTVRLTGRWNLTGKACRTRVSDCTLAQPRRDAHWRKAVEQRRPPSAFVTFGAPPAWFGGFRMLCLSLKLKKKKKKKKGRWLVALRWGGASGDW